MRIGLVLTAGLPFGGPAALFLRAQEPAVAFVAAFREQGTAWFIDEEGKALYVQQGSGAPRKSVDLRLPVGKPFVWERPPSGLARFGDQWLVVNGRPTLFSFSPAGVAISNESLPVQASDVYSDGGVLWICNPVAQDGSRRVWRSADAKKFSAVPVPSPRASSDAIGTLLQSQLVATVGLRGGFYFAQLVGPPVLIRIDANGNSDRFALAYSRTRQRAALEQFSSSQEDLEKYSSPVRDLLVAPNRDILVLRNREDVRTGGGGPESQQSRRVDRYTEGGRHVGTASFEEKIRWLLRDEGRAVTVLSSAGRVLTRPLGSPLAGGIVE